MGMPEAMIPVGERRGRPNRFARWSQSRSQYARAEMPPARTATPTRAPPLPSGIHHPNNPGDREFPRYTSTRSGSPGLSPYSASYAGRISTGRRSRNARATELVTPSAPTTTWASYSRRLPSAPVATTWGAPSGARPRSPSNRTPVSKRAPLRAARSASATSRAARSMTYARGSGAVNSTARSEGAKTAAPWTGRRTNALLPARASTRADTRPAHWTGRPTRPCSSRTRTSWPARASRSATVEPAGPAPTTRTSVRSTPTDARGPT